jgi:putative exporter of polyketide antibiotics
MGDTAAIRADGSTKRYRQTLSVLIVLAVIVVVIGIVAFERRDVRE